MTRKIESSSNEWYHKPLWATLIGGVLLAILTIYVYRVTQWKDNLDMRRQEVQEKAPNMTFWEWNLQVWRETLHHHVDSMNNSPISGQEGSYTLKDIVNNLRAYFSEAVIAEYKKFLQPTSTQDMYWDYPQKTTLEAFMKLREKLGKSLEIHVIRPNMDSIDFDRV
jgi:hypothetical protein